MDFGNYAYMGDYLQNWQYPMWQYGYGANGSGYNFNGYNPYGGYQMPLFNYYPQQNTPVNFTGGQTQQAQTATAAEEKPKTQYVTQNGSPVYETTSEKAAEYKEKHKKLVNNVTIGQVATAIVAITALAVFTPKILKAINPKAGSFLDDMAKLSIGEQRFWGGMGGSVLALVGCGCGEIAYNSKQKKLVKEYLGEPLDYKA